MGEFYQFTSEERRIYEGMTIPFVIYQYVNLRTVAILVSDGYCKLAMQSREDALHLLNTDMYRDTHPDDVARVSDEANRMAAEGGVYDVVYRTYVETLHDYAVVHAHSDVVTTADGQRLFFTTYLDETSYARADSNQLGSFSDSFRETLYKRMPRLENYYDSLTGLPNVAYFMYLAQASKEKMLESGEHLTYLAFDLIGMKSYNDRYGMEEGDRLLRGFARLLSQFFGNENCSRFGEDHFYGLLTAHRTKKQVERVLENLFASVGELNGGHSITVRCGIYPDRFSDVEANVACDRAFIACNSDRSIFTSHYTWFDREFYRELQLRDYVVRNVDRALDKGWIQVYYQPIVDTWSHEIIYVESLCRWNDPKKGLLMPALFIPALERARLLYKVDLKVVDLTLQNLKERESQGKETVPASVNLSRYDFDSCDIVQEICKRVEEVGVDPKNLIIEITESVLGLDTDYLVKQVERFHEAGFQVWMDDFGSDYSSIYTLQRFEFDLIKLDMHFMKNFSEGVKKSKNRKIIEGLIRIFRDLRIQTLCEGVESEEQLDFLKDVGCDAIQGYLFYKPMPVEELPDGEDMR